MSAFINKAQKMPDKNPAGLMADRTEKTSNPPELGSGWEAVSD